MRLAVGEAGGALQKLGRPLIGFGGLRRFTDLWSLP